MGIPHLSEIMRILIVEDERLLRIQLKNELEHPSAQVGTSQKHHIIPVANFEEARGILQAQAIDIAFIDLNLGPGGDGAGLRLLEHVRTNYPNTVSIVMTGVEDSNIVEQCLRLGAADYIFKPFEPRIVHHLLIKAVVHHKLFRRAQTLRAQGGDRIVEPMRLSSKSPAFQKVLEQTEKLKGKNLRVLITGETGTGKEVMAQYLWSLEEDFDRPFIPVHCGAISENLVESALFGHVKGAFTGATEDKKGFFEDADGGDIFLDEIGTMPLDLQIKTLRTLNSGEVVKVGKTSGRKFDFRVIAATNENLDELVKKGLFREDLLYRIKEVEIKLPPLRERREDIPDLAVQFLEKCGHESKHLSESAIDLLKNYSWPGNLRQLEKSIRILSELSESQEITEFDVRKYLSGFSKDISIPSSSENLIFGVAEKDFEKRFDELTEQLQQSMIKMALEKTKSSRKAAEYLGISRGILRGKIAAWGWQSPT